MRVVDLGEHVDYETGIARMRHEMTLVDDDGPRLLLLAHQPTLTITRRGGRTAFVSPAELIERDGIAVVEADRGGDVTFHGPGQLTGYPLLRLSDTSLGADVVGYVRALEAALVAACQTLGVSDARAFPGKDAEGHFLTGVWCDAPVVSAETLGCHFHTVERQPAKLCALGVGLGGGITRHGFALNVTTDLERYTRHIVPCGLKDRGVTSLERVLPRAPPWDRVKSVVVDAVVAALTPWHKQKARMSVGP
jgi:lipoyl(octanoyl) transferase